MSDRASNEWVSRVRVKCNHCEAVFVKGMIDRHHMLGKQDEFGSALAKLAHADGWEPTFVFRLGYAEREAPRSPRRPLASVVKGVLAVAH